MHWPSFLEANSLAGDHFRISVGKGRPAEQNVCEGTACHFQEIPSPMHRSGSILKSRFYWSMPSSSTMSASLSATAA
jgi:hypothetical protein